jgi:hypothetical protein
MPVIVTHCDIHFLSRAIALILSVRQTSGLREIWVYTHDEETFRILNTLELQNVKVISSQVLVTNYTELEVCRKTKSKLEFLFALTPFMILHAVEITKRNVWYIDADVYFLNSLTDLENQTKDRSILVSAHNFPSRLRMLEKYGKYNVGVIYVSGDQESKDTIRWWATKCIEDTSCFSRDDVYGDQKYLDKFPVLNSKFGVFASLENCAAPWNIEEVKNFPPTTFHFSGLRRYKYFSFIGLSTYGIKFRRGYRIHIYGPYNKQLDKIEEEIYGIKKTDTRKLSSRAFARMILFRDAQIRYLR